MPVLKNARHERMAQLIASGETATDAHEHAGYKRHDGNASIMANRDDIRGRVEEIRGNAAQKVEKRLEIDKAWVLSKLIENANRAMKAEPVVDSDGKPIGEYRYHGDWANRALELIGKELKMFIERREVGNAGDFAALNDQELADQVVAELASAGHDPTAIRRMIEGDRGTEH